MLNEDLLQTFKKCLSASELEEFFRHHHEMMQQEEERIRQALADDDLPALGHAAHKIAGSAGTPCLPLVYRLSLDLNEAVRIGHREQARTLAAQLLTARPKAWKMLVDRLPQRNPD
ncbi:Hpt domain-containing protein [Desulfurivibrio dismutans]|uniref:Hpt domain-containing protein n=1 Tax=Desulfurivibrio dismutans TaxID=1398908 RepID=UPI0023DC3C45|nr:Hpt domain-containing protein [Desulfurivibrio alkaliphilus]MDF1614809.1 Hpt domain-containing protein [Desulfurivibrio alkaliphilus]